MITTGSPLYAPRPTLCPLEGESAGTIHRPAAGAARCRPGLYGRFDAGTCSIKCAAGTVCPFEKQGVETAGITYHDGRSSQTASDGSGWQLVTYNGLLRTDQSPVHVKRRSIRPG